MSEQSLNDILSGGGLSSLLQNPEVASKLPRIMEALGPVIAEMRAEKEDGSAESGDKKESDGPDAKEAVKLLSAASSKGKSSASSNRMALLCALEPYLSQNRREAMEYIGRVLTLIDLLTEVM